MQKLANETHRVGRPISITFTSMKKTIHYPTMKTVLAVEDVIRNSKDYLTKTEIRNRLDKQIMMQTLNFILAYLEDSGKIMITRDGVIWTRHDNSKFSKLVKKSKGYKL